MQPWRQVRPMKKIKAIIGVIKVLLFFCMVLSAGNAFAQISNPITIPTFPGKSVCDNDFPVGAIASNPGIPLIYTSSDESVATVSTAGIIHIVGQGSTIITAFQPSNPFVGSAVLNVTAPGPPTVTIVADQTTVCMGKPVVFTATVNELGATPTYQWEVNNIAVGTNSPTYNAIGLVPTDVVICIATIGNCHLTGTSNAITGIKTNPYLASSVSIKPSVTGTICSGSTVSFTASPVNAGTNPTYQWQVNGVNAGTNAATFSSNTLANGDNVTCTLTVISAGCFTPTTTSSNNIVISAVAASIGNVSIMASANNVTSGTPVTFTASSTLPASSYQWQVNGMNAGTNSPTFTTRNLRNGDVVTCIALIVAACTAPVASQPIIMTILPPPAISITNTFTPNGDGINDLWDIPDLAFYPNCMVYIYNRYGIKVYQSRGYDKSWDGTYNGRKLPASTYYYVIELNGPTNNNKMGGHITIIR